MLALSGQTWRIKPEDPGENNRPWMGDHYSGKPGLQKGPASALCYPGPSLILLIHDGGRFICKLLRHNIAFHP